MKSPLTPRPDVVRAVVSIVNSSSQQRPVAASIAARITSLSVYAERRCYSSRKRHLHLTSSKEVAIPVSAKYHAPTTTTTPTTTSSQSSPLAPAQASPLKDLPLLQVLRTYFITSISSSPILLEQSSRLLKLMLESRNPLFRIDTNPLIRFLLWETFYKQFCAGNDRAQIDQICRELRAQGYSGVILEYALEVLKDAHTDEAADIATWRAGMLASVDMAAPGDFVGLKWSGLGPAAMNRMKDQLDPSPAMAEAMHAVCRAAQAKDVALLPAAEETWNLAGYQAWSLGLQRTYNVHGRSVLYNTYQAYLKQAAGTLAAHLAIAKEEGFTLGIKLVRGAYLATEKRELIWPSIEATHRNYDEIMAALLRRQYNAVLQPADAGEVAMPEINVVLATHNAATVTKARALREEQRARGEARVPLVFAQLQGMADEVSCGLIAACRDKDGTVQERVLKCTTWGTMYECLNYLLRRAAENKDAASRTADTRRAMQAEIVRRLKVVVGLA